MYPASPGKCPDRVLPQQRSNVVLEYTGWASDLVASGLVPKAWLRPTGKHLRDPDGNKVTVVRYWRKQNGKPKRYCRIPAEKATKALAIQLPGVAGGHHRCNAHVQWQARRLSCRPIIGSPPHFS